MTTSYDHEYYYRDYYGLGVDDRVESESDDYDEVQAQAEFVGLDDPDLEHDWNHGRFDRDSEGRLIVPSQTTWELHSRGGSADENFEMAREHFS